MSVSASIGISLFRETNTNIPGSIILPVLIDSGWRISSNGTVGYLPAETNDVAEWQYACINFDSLLNIFKIKEIKKEITGVRLFWQDTQVACNFTFFPDDIMKTLSININQDRQLVTFASGYEMTNFQWYLEKLLPPLDKAFEVEFVSCKHHR